MIVRPGIPDELRWFYHARFGMFVHFGISSLLGRGEWVMYWDNIPREEYEKLADRFNPTMFSAADWVGLAVDAGARYMTVTAKHHDGFCLFDSKLTDFTSVNTPFGRDIVGEIADACAKRSLPLVLYYSQPDWHHPNFVHHAGAFKDLDSPPATDEPDWQRYLEFYIGQVEELMKQYEPAGIWFDGSHKTETEWRGREVYELIKRYNPSAVVNDRGRYGDMFTPERSLPEDLTGYLFEACQSVSKQAWGYREDATHFSVPELIRSLQKVAAAGGNYLLNVGPKPDGSIDPVQRRIMETIGRWLDIHGEAIYETEPVEVAGKSNSGPDGGLLPPNLRLTGRDSSAYVHILDWPDTDRIRIPAGRLGAVTSISAVGLSATSVPPSGASPSGASPAVGEAGLDDTEGPSVSGRTGDLEIHLPPAPWQPLPAVIKLELDAPIPTKTRPADERPAVWPLEVGATGESRVLLLEPRDLARLGRGPKGKRVQTIVIPGYGECLAGWMDAAQSVSFAVEIGNHAEVELCVDVAVPRGLDDGVLSVEVDGEHAVNIELSGSYENEPDDSARGRLTVPCSRDFAGYRTTLSNLENGRHEVRVYPGKLQWGYLFGFVGRILVVARE